MSYKTYAPGRDPEAFVKCYRTLEMPKETEPERQGTVPDGCMEMIILDSE